MLSVKNNVSTLLYRFRGNILGVIAVALALAPPSLLPDELYINNCVAGMLIALLLYIISAFLRVQTRRYIGEHTRGKVHAADSLVTSGPYAHVRHPLYISKTGFALGIAFFHLGVSFWVVPFMFVVIVFEVALSQIEDMFLEQKFGDDWRAWASKTPAIFPRLGDAKHVLPQRTFWQAFFADSSTWLWLLFCNLLLVLRKVAYFYV